MPMPMSPQLCCLQFAGGRWAIGGPQGHVVAPRQQPWHIAPHPLPWHIQGVFAKAVPALLCHLGTHGMCHLHQGALAVGWPTTHHPSTSPHLG